MNTNTKFYLTSNLSKKKGLSNSLSTSNFPLISTTTYSKPMNIKTVKVTDMYKNLYHKDTGKAINSILQQQKDNNKINEEMESNKKK